MMQKSNSQLSGFGKWLREPLLHFLLIGGLLFVVFNVRNDSVINDEKHITISAEQINALSLQWRQRWQRSPTADELQSMIEQKIRNEVLYREAVAMGLDKNDPVVRRRLAQKISFIFTGLSEVVEPTDAELQGYLDAHAEKYAVPARRNFVQIYFNVQQRGEPARQDARRVLHTLTQSGTHVDLDELGDTSMLARQYRQASQQDVARLFGGDFARDLFDVPAGSWQGPVVSSYGLHLIYVADKTASQLSTLEAMRDRLRQDWMARQRQDFDEAFYQGLRQRYQIVVEDSVAGDAVFRPGVASTEK